MRSICLITLAMCLGFTAEARVTAKLDYDKKVVGPITLKPGFGGVSNTTLGTHYRVFVVQKNQGKENEAVVYSELDENCRFQADREVQGQPSFDFYWWMENRSFYKSVASMAKPYMRKGFSVVGNGATGSFSLESGHIKKIAKEDIGANPNFVVRAEKNGANCEVNAYITIKGKVIRINSFYVHSQKASLFNQDPAICKIILNDKEPTKAVLKGDPSQDGFDDACSTEE